MKTITKEQEIAEIIAIQMGGIKRLSIMTGASNFTCDEKGALSFRFKMCNKTNHIKIELNTNDLYNITFYKIRKYDFKVVKTINNVYCDMLVEIFERETGLYLSI